MWGFAIKKEENLKEKDIVMVDKYDTTNKYDNFQINQVHKP